MTTPARPSPARVRRLAEELAESGFDLDVDDPWGALLLEDIDYALRPKVHERRVSSYGSIVDPTTDPSTWDAGPSLTITRRDGRRHAADRRPSLRRRPVELADPTHRRARRVGGVRPAVRIRARPRRAGRGARRHGRAAPPGRGRAGGRDATACSAGTASAGTTSRRISTWIDSVSACALHGDRRRARDLLEFAVHDLGARGIGAILVYRPDGDPAPGARGAARRCRRPCRSPAGRPGAAAPRPGPDRRGGGVRRRRHAPRARRPAGAERRRPSRRWTGTAACATPPGGATATTIPPPRSSSSARTDR